MEVYCAYIDGCNSGTKVSIRSHEIQSDVNHAVKRGAAFEQAWGYTPQKAVEKLKAYMMERVNFYEQRAKQLRYAASMAYVTTGVQEV